MRRPKWGRVRAFVFWTGAWWPRHRFYVDMLDKPAPFYCRQLDWLCVRVMWHLNTSGLVRRWAE